MKVYGTMEALLTYPEDKRVNEDALRHGQRLLSAYHTRLSDKLWVITEWDRSVTTLLLPEEY